MWRCHVLICVICVWIKLLFCNMSISLCLVSNSFKITQLGFKSEHRLVFSSGNDDTPSSLICNDTLCSQSVVWSRIVLITHQMHRFDCLCAYCKQNGPLSLFSPPGYCGGGFLGSSPHCPDVGGRKSWDVTSFDTPHGRWPTLPLRAVSLREGGRRVVGKGG